MQEDQASELEQLLEENPEASAGLAIRELHYGRLEWLAEHIRRCDFQISPLVAVKLLALIEESDPNLLYKLVASRRSNVPSAKRDPQLTEHRNFDMAIEVAQLGGFERGHGKSVYSVVGQRYNLCPDYAYRCVRPYKQLAMEVVEEERMRAKYLASEVDILGRSFSPRKGFVGGPAEE